MSISWTDKHNLEAFCSYLTALCCHSSSFLNYWTYTRKDIRHCYVSIIKKIYSDMSFHKITCGIPFVDLSPSLRLLKSVQMFKSKKKRLETYLYYFIFNQHIIYTRMQNLLAGRAFGLLRTASSLTWKKHESVFLKKHFNKYILHDGHYTILHIVLPFVSFFETFMK